jgi:hypothetical protein
MMIPRGLVASGKALVHLAEIGRADPGPPHVWTAPRMQEGK